MTRIAVMFNTPARGVQQFIIVVIDALRGLTSTPLWVFLRR